MNAKATKAAPATDLEGLMQHKSVIAIYPHPDDETFGKGGTLALHAKHGADVTVVCGTLGQMGRNMGKPFFATRESMPEIRRVELQNACDALGVTNLRLLGMRDKMMEFEDPEHVADLIEAILREVKPAVCYMYYPPYGVHPDHDAISVAALIAIRRLPEAERPIVYASAVTRDRDEVLGSPDVTLDVSEVIDQKIAAYRAHKSQSAAMMSRMDEQIKEDPALREQLEAPHRREVYWIYPV